MHSDLTNERAQVRQRWGQALRVYIAVSTRLYREGLSNALGMSSELAIIGASGDVSVVTEDVACLTPDIVLVDVGTQKFFHALDAIRRVNPGGQIVALSVPDRRSSILACAEAGVAGYVTRNGSVDDLRRVILAADAGEFECTPSVAAAFVERLSQRISSPSAGCQISSLTARELDVIRLLEHGLCNKDIARELSIKLPTVKNHVHNIISKLHVHGRCEAAALYRRIYPNSKAQCLDPKI